MMMTTMMMSIPMRGSRKVTIMKMNNIYQTASSSSTTTKIMMATKRLFGSSSETSSPKTTIAVIGTGWWSQGWHLPHLSRNKNIKIVVVDQNPNPKSNLNPNLESLSTLAKRYNNAPYFHSTEKMLQDPIIGPTLDGAIVATPHASHYAIGESLIQEGMRRQQQATTASTNDEYRPIHILMEKPMTTDIHEGKKLHDVSLSSRCLACF